MGETLECTEDKEIVMTIKFKKPDSNHNTYGGSNQPVIDHIDLIAGEVGGVIYPFDENPNYDVADPNSGSAAVVNPQYSNPNCPEGTVKVIKTFTSSDWGTKDKDGYYSITYKLAKTDKSMYYRLRGTNLAKGTPGQTDLNGNPLCDQQFQWLGDTSSAISTNNGAKAFEDLWFYSNPIFVQKQQ